MKKKKCFIKIDDCVIGRRDEEKLLITINEENMKKRILYVLTYRQTTHTLEF